MYTYAQDENGVSAVPQASLRNWVTVGDLGRLLAVEGPGFRQGHLNLDASFYICLVTEDFIVAESRYWRGCGDEVKRRKRIQELCLHAGTACEIAVWVQDYPPTFHTDVVD